MSPGLRTPVDQWAPVTPEYLAGRRFVTPPSKKKRGLLALTQELVRDPVAFGAKEKRLLGTVKDLDAKLERLNKDRDTALRK